MKTILMVVLLLTGCQSANIQPTNTEWMTANNHKADVKAASSGMVTAMVPIFILTWSIAHFFEQNKAR